MIALAEIRESSEYGESLNSEAAANKDWRCFLHVDPHLCETRYQIKCLFHSDRTIACETAKPLDFQSVMISLIAVLTCAIGATQASARRYPSRVTERSCRSREQQRANLFLQRRNSPAYQVLSYPKPPGSADKGLHSASARDTVMAASATDFAMLVPCPYVRLKAIWF